MKVNTVTCTLQWTGIKGTVFKGMLVYLSPLMCCLLFGSQFMSTNTFDHWMSYRCVKYCHNGLN